MEETKSSLPVTFKGGEEVIGFIPISVRLNGDAIVTRSTTITATITPTQQMSSGTTDYVLDYYAATGISDGTSGVKYLELTPLSTAAKTGITQEPALITSYGDSAGVVLTVSPQQTEGMYLVVVATPIYEIRPTTESIGLAVVPIVPETIEE